MNTRTREHGGINGGLVGIILLTLAVVALAGLSIWLYVQYKDQKDNVDSKIGAAVATAQKKQADEDEKKFAEREKEPNATFVGPTDFGRLSFGYPKTWSVYVANNGKDSDEYLAYFNRQVVPPVDDQGQRFALRVMIQSQKFDEVVAEYQSQIEDGELKSSSISVNGQSATRLDGKFSEDVRGAVVIFKIRDKTVSVFTDADTFKTDFGKIIRSIEFNQ